MLLQQKKLSTLILISQLFSSDNIRDGTSLDKLYNWGGVDGLENTFNTSFRVTFSQQAGIQSSTTKQRAQAFGDNMPIIKEPKTFLELILENFEDDTLRLLCIAAVLSLVLGILSHGIKQGWLQGVSILFAVVIIVSVTSVNNYMKEKQFRNLTAIASKKNVWCFRDGKKIHLDSSLLLTGDVVQLQTGQILSVDGVLIKGNNITADQSSITGESDLIKKNTLEQEADPSNPFLISGSMLMQGTGSMMVVAVGVNSQYGRLKLKIQQDPDKTPLQQKLQILAVKIGDIGFYSAAATFIAMFIHFLYDCYMSEQSIQYFLSYDTLNEILEYFIIAVSIVVVAVPQGLPLAVTISLAYSVGKMLNENNLVRYLQACQTMGGANNICTDKTGTLTKNQMSVTKLFIQQQVTNKIQASIIKNDICELLCTSVCINSNANPSIDSNHKFTQLGNKTQCALIQMAYKMGFHFEKIRKNGDSILKIFPFSSARKKMSSIHEYKNGDIKLYTKGAPDFLLQKCTKYVNRQGKIVNINKQYIAVLQQTVTNFASQSLRNILVAYRDIESSEKWKDTPPEQLENDLIILGMTGIKDPLRDEIPFAVQQCHDAGVTVRMVTGDNKQTAVAIAKEAGILQKNWRYDPYSKKVMQGKQFRQFVGGLVKEQERDSERVGNLQNFKVIAKQLKVLARSSPQDKYIMATGLKQLTHVVAMTGDGTNDAPALKKADIGFAMGIAGTQVAKQASGIILLDDNFKSIVTAIKYGRNIFECIRKFIQFQLTVNFVAIVLAFLGGAILRQSPLNAIQMLWVNLIMDTLASLSLATEPPSEQLLKRQPYSRYESLITSAMWKNIIFQSIFQVIVLCIILFKGKIIQLGPFILGVPSSINVMDWNNETGKHYAIFFHVFVLLQLFNEINARKLKPQQINVFADFFNNPLYFVIALMQFATQVAIVQYGGKAVKCVPLTVNEHMLCFLIGSMSLYFGYIIKALLPQHFIIQSYRFQFGPIRYQWGQPPQKQD